MLARGLRAVKGASARYADALAVGSGAAPSRTALWLSVRPSQARTPRAKPSAKEVQASAGIQPLRRLAASFKRLLA